MDITFKCPVCRQDLAVDAAGAGTAISCPSCTRSITIPATSETAAPPLRVSVVKPAEGNGELPPDDAKLAQRLTTAFQQLSTEVGKLIVGQNEVIEQIVTAMFARSHCLLEGVPGLAKTYMVKSVSEAMNLSFHRVQFTPDLMPADITGTDIISEDPATGKRTMTFLKGPIFAQMILADEINRSPPKTQAALLEAMQEHSVTVGGQTYRLKEPFFVLATQNPVEQEGTYPLPEAQKDRFMFHVKVTYPSRDEEREIIRRTTSAYEAKIEPVLSGEEVIQIQKIVRKVPVPDHVTDFVLELVRRSRPNEEDALPFAKELIAWGPGPRACQQLVLGGKVRAVLRGRFHVTIDDIEALAYPVLRHRIVPTFNAEAEGIQVDDIIKRILEATPKGDVKQVL
ncbi:MAG TPA: MoxR family ATPase [Roseimicrobium sp.]|nr:MoxR family ATPase [Roseimicrobium sp.]